MMIDATRESIRLGNLCTSYRAVIQHLEDTLVRRGRYGEVVSQTARVLRVELWRLQSKKNAFDKKHFPKE